MGVIYPKLNDINNATASPVAQRKERFPASVFLLHQVQEDRALRGSEGARNRGLRLGRRINHETTRRVLLKQRFVLDQPLTDCCHEHMVDCWYKRNRVPRLGGYSALIFLIVEPVDIQAGVIRRVD